MLYPPGISAKQRRRVRLWRGWVVLGLVGVLGLFISLAEAGASRLVIITVCAGFYALGAVAVAHSAGPIRWQVLELTATRSNFAPESRHIAECGYLMRLVVTVQTADESLNRGVLAPADHEMVWAAVYADAQRHLSLAHNDR